MKRDPGDGGTRPTVIAVTIAVLVHVAVAVVMARRTSAARDARPPGVQGLGFREAAVGGLPVSKRRNAHEFRIRDYADGAALPRVRVTDVLGGEVATTGADGRAALYVRPSAKLLVHAEKAGYALHVRQYANTSSDAQTHEVFLERAAIPYAFVDTVFIQRCIYCHGSAASAGAVDLTSHEALMQSRSGAVAIVKPFNPDSSRLIRVLVDTVDAQGRRVGHARRTSRIPDYEIELLAEWVRQGARKVAPP